MYTYKYILCYILLYMCSLSGPETDKRKRVMSKADGKLMLLVSLCVSGTKS